MEYLRSEMKELRFRERLDTLKFAQWIGVELAKKSSSRAMILIVIIIHC